MYGSDYAPIISNIRQDCVLLSDTILLKISDLLAKYRIKTLQKKRIALPFFFIIALAVCSYATVHATHGQSKAVSVFSIKNQKQTLETDQIKVMTINLAHGRGDGKSQILQSNEVIKDNVTAIGHLIAKEAAQVVALQEADAPSWWSGNYSHVNAIGKLAGMSSAVQGSNIEGLGLQYGTAVVTQLEVSEARQVTFEKNVPTLSKGFVVVASEWPGDSSFKFDVISLHLDFASNDVRKKQLAVLAETVKNSGKPVIMMGDFNTDMSEELLPAFLKQTQLKAWKADDTSIVTFPFLNSRIDWILVSPAFEIAQQTVLDEVLSDHKILTAVIKRQDQQTL